MAVRQSLPTDKQLVITARRIVLKPMQGRAVFYHGDEGCRRADLFVRQRAGHSRIDDLLRRNQEGQELLRLLGDKPWANKEEVRWELSRGTRTHIRYSKKSNSRSLKTTSALRQSTITTVHQ
jgi:hypothetical protein